MKTQDQIAQLNREIEARRLNVEALKKKLAEDKAADMARIRKGVKYSVVRVENCTAPKLKALGAVTLVLETDTPALDAEMLKHAEQYGPPERDGVFNKTLRSLAYYYAGGRIWGESGGSVILARESNDSWGGGQRHRGDGRRVAKHIARQDTTTAGEHPVFQHRLAFHAVRPLLFCQSLGFIGFLVDSVGR